MTRQGLRKIIDFPLKLYQNLPFYIPALAMDKINTLYWEKNPAFDHYEARYDWLIRDTRSSAE